MQINRIHNYFNRFRRRFFSNVYFTRLAIICLALAILLGGWLLFHSPVGELFQGFRLITGQPLPQSAGRTNIVFLGTGGVGHEGPDLTDTVILASIKLDTGETTLISVPRDMWVASIRDKINSAYHYGLVKQATSGGLLMAKSVVNESLGVPVHFAVKVDFSAFIKAIDILGGVDVTVDRDFTDDQYPIPGKEDDLCGGDPDTKCRYETIHYSAGPQHFDGAQALKFVRSRHSVDPQEGTDFARSQRQEKVISAFRSKLLSIKNLKNSQVYKDLYALAQESVVTDITPEYYSTFFQLGLKMRRTPFKTYSLEDQLENPAITSRYDYKWVLIPKSGDPQTLFNFVAGLLN